MKKLIHIAGILLIAIGCKQTFAPPAITHPPDYLVVEGYFETNGADPTIFKLTHTTKIDTIERFPETGAHVTVEGTDNNVYPLADAGNGAYTAALNQLNHSISYRLHIVTAAGKQYASDYVPLVNNPLIDSITWARQNTGGKDGVQIYANTHDPQNNTHYYRWSYQETWQFHTKFEQSVVYDPVNIRFVGAINLNNYTCWHTDSATSIVLGNSSQLSQDLIYHGPLVYIPDGSQQLMVRYSILVKQYALTKDAFAWWQVLQKNTEQIGSIFGVQPSANPGNIHSLTDTAEQVLGYVYGCNTNSKRIFIDNSQVLPWNYDSGCVDDVEPIGKAVKLVSAGILPWLLDEVNGVVHLSDAKCVDCTLTGSNKKPSFWQ